MDGAPPETFKHPSKDEQCYGPYLSPEVPLRSIRRYVTCQCFFCISEYRTFWETIKLSVGTFSCQDKRPVENVSKLHVSYVIKYEITLAHVSTRPFYIVSGCFLGGRPMFFCYLIRYPCLFSLSLGRFTCPLPKELLHYDLVPSKLRLIHKYSPPLSSHSVRLRCRTHFRDVVHPVL